MARTATPTPILKESRLNEVVVQEGSQALNALALADTQQETMARAVAIKVGYQLPGDVVDADLIQRDIGINMRRSVEACLDVGRGLSVLRAACPHGNFVQRLDVMGIEPRVAQKFMQAAAKFSNTPSTALLKAAGNQTKLFELLVLDDEQIAEFELTGESGELSLDDVTSMSVKELRTAVRELRQDKQADESLIADKSKQLDKLKRKIAKETPDDVWAQLQQEATTLLHDAQGCIKGQLRQALMALRAHSDVHEIDCEVFMAGLVGQVQADVTALRTEFNLADVSTAADHEAMAFLKAMDEEDRAAKGSK